MGKINLTINGINVSAKPGQTILDAARENDMFIPTLCHDDRLKPFGSCLLCRVEVEGARGNMLACGTQVTEGMIVRTETESVNDSRKVCLELLLSQHYGDCKAPCSMTCPAGIDVQGYIAHIANGDYQEAVGLIKERNPLPLVCGRVCTRPCEDECRRNLVDERVGIDYLKRFASDYDLKSGNPFMPKQKDKTGKKAAVIGAGPAGLSCAYYLALEGHDVTIFEKWPKGGGMLRYGIPEYRLPKDALDAEINLIEKMGVEIKYNNRFGTDVTNESLKQEGFEAIFLGIGSQIGQPMGCDGEECTLGVYSGVDFLGRVGLEERMNYTGKKVIVVGGGNTAVDAARTALRLGADQVKIAYRRTKKEMPAHEMEIEEAEFEGVELDLLIAPQKLTRNAEGKIEVEFIKMELGEPDASGRRRPDPVQGSEYIEIADYVIAAIGQTQDLSFVNDSFKLASEKSKIKVNADLMTTNLDGVFAGGDVVTGPQTAIKAIAAGRVAAYSMDKYLKGEEITKLPDLYNHIKGDLDKLDKTEFEKYEKITKEKMPMLGKVERQRNFKEVELGFSEEQAKKEAERCLSCGCKDVNECKLREFATAYDAKQDRLAGEITKHPIDETHPFITRDQNKCIMCGRCVRICHELQGAGALGFISRGYNTVISPSFGQDFGEESRCESCGQCVSSCPVGALTEKVNLSKPGPFVEESIDTICNYCGTGCTISINTAGNKYIRTTSKVGSGINNGNLCEKGRFGNDFINSEERLKTPMIKKNGKFMVATWDEAYEVISKKLNQAKAEDDNVAVYLSGKMTNEEAYLANKLALQGLNTKKVTSFGDKDKACALKEALGACAGNATYEDIKAADTIIVLGFDIKEKNPVAALMVKEAAEKGARLILINDKPSKLDRYANQVINTGLYDLSVLKEKLENSKKPLVIIGGDIERDIVVQVGNLVKDLNKADHSILFMQRKANDQGIIDILSKNNFCCTSNNTAEYNIVFGEYPLDDNKEEILKTLDSTVFTVVCDMFMTETAQVADVILPLVSFAETSGTYTNSEKRVQKLSQALKPITGKENYQVIMGIAKAIGMDMNYRSTDEIFEEIK